MLLLTSVLPTRRALALGAVREQVADGHGQIVVGFINPALG